MLESSQQRPRHSSFSTRFRHCRTAVLAGGLAIASFGGAMPPAGAAVYCDVPITMSDGTVLSANVSVPDAPGSHPTILTITPYGKDGATAGSGLSGCATNVGSAAEAGYATMILDVRGAGRSQGVYNTFGRQERSDTAEVLDWIQAQSWSNGKVGVTGGSALGISTLHAVTADQQRMASGKPRAVFAAWADCPFPDLYRDAFMDVGGMGAQSILVAGTANVGAGHVAAYRPVDVGPAEQFSYFLNYVFNNTVTGLRRDFHTDGDLMYYNDWFRERDVSPFAPQVDIPVALTAGESDAINSQHAVVYYFDQLVASPKRVMFLSPGGHCATSNFAQLGFGSKNDLVIAWFDHWLRGIDNGIDSFPEVNMYPLGGNEWLQAGAHPIPSTEWTRFYLSSEPSGSITSLNDGGLSTSLRSPGRDALPYTPAHVATLPPCTGIAACGGSMPGAEAALTYTSPPLEQDTLIAGLITAQLFAAFDRQEGTFGLTLWDVPPEGQASVISQGWLRGTLRAIDPVRTTYGPGGIVIRPYHPMTRESKLPIEGNTDEYLIEFNAVSALVAEGHRIRLSVSITEGTLDQSAYLNAATVGETMLLSHGSAQTPSNVLLPLVPIGD